MNLNDELPKKVRPSWVRFHQSFMSSFYESRSQKRKKDTDDLNVFFAHLGSAPIKAARKMLMKLTPDAALMSCLSRRDF